MTKTSKMELSIITLKHGREKSILRKHPWIFSGAIQKVEGNPAAGETVLVHDSHGHALAVGAYNPISQIRVRIWSFDPSEKINRVFFKNIISRALQSRTKAATLKNTNSYRLIHAESDWLPGVVVDKFGDTTVMQLSSAGAYYWRDVLIEEIIAQTGCVSLFEKSDSDVIQLEGLDKVVKFHLGGGIEDRIIIEESGLKYILEIEGGQKSGFYLDQRGNRQIIREYSGDKEVLDCFCFSGGFSLNALAGGARSVSAVDSSNPALDLLRENLQINGFEPSSVEIVNENVFEFLRKLRDKGRQFDLIVLDPPKLAPTTAQVEKASRAYKDINLLAFKLLKDGGYLITFSCSGGVSMPLFQKITSDAALDAGKNTQIIRYLHQAEDHPIASTFPEGEYLKGIIWKLTE